MPQSVDLASLLCSRLCHDLLSPVGALSNGIELLRDERDPEMRQRCMELLEQSTRISADKLKFFRLAYGAAGGFGEDVAVEEPRELVRALVENNGRIALDWAVREERLPKRAVKVLLNLAAIGIDALPRGGQLDIGAERRDGAAEIAVRAAGEKIAFDETIGAAEIAVRAAGEKIAFDETIGAALDGTLPPAELSGRTAPAYMIRQIAEAAGGGLQYALTDGALVMGAVLPDA